MENSETIAGTSLENPDGLHKDEGVLHQVKEANKEDGKEVSVCQMESQVKYTQVFNLCLHVYMYIPFHSMYTYLQLCLARTWVDLLSL